MGRGGGGRVGSGSQSGERRGQWEQGKGADFFGWDAPQVLASTGLGGGEEAFGMAPRVWLGLEYRAGGDGPEQVREGPEISPPAWPPPPPPLQLQQCPGTSAAPLGGVPGFRRHDSSPSLTVLLHVRPGILHLRGCAQLGPRSAHLEPWNPLPHPFPGLSLLRVVWALIDGAPSSPRGGRDAAVCRQ